jgi:hypothetical protein
MTATFFCLFFSLFFPKGLKGTLTRDFRPLFFHQTTSPGSLIHRIREDNRQSWLHTVHSGVIDIAVPQTSRILRHTVFLKEI